jgi:hypothetical protein
MMETKKERTARAKREKQILAALPSFTPEDIGHLIAREQDLLVAEIGGAIVWYERIKKRSPEKTKASLLAGRHSLIATAEWLEQFFLADAPSPILEKEGNHAWNFARNYIGHRDDYGFWPSVVQRLKHLAKNIDEELIDYDLTYTGKREDYAKFLLVRHLLKIWLGGLGELPPISLEGPFAQLVRACFRIAGEDNPGDLRAIIKKAVQAEERVISTSAVFKRTKE